MDQTAARREAVPKQKGKHSKVLTSSLPAEKVQIDPFNSPHSGQLPSNHPKPQVRATRGGPWLQRSAAANAALEPDRRATLSPASHFQTRRRKPRKPEQGTAARLPLAFVVFCFSLFRTTDHFHLSTALFGAPSPRRHVRPRRRRCSDVSAAQASRTSAGGPCHLQFNPKP